MAVPGLLFGVEGIDVLKVRRRGVETFSVDAQVSVIIELNAVAAHGHHALDVELVLRKVVDAFGFEELIGKCFLPARLYLTLRG